jgi:hypothetical protein
MRVVAIALVFAVQVAGIVYARFVDTRYLSWAPYDQIAFYRIDANRDGVELTPDEITTRYRMPASGRENRSIHHVFRAIAQFEATYGRTDAVRVRVAYRVNGRAEEIWTLPR